MIRRNARLRKEYIYRKSLEGTEREVYEKKRKIKDALAKGQAIPHELRDDYHELKQAIDRDDAVTSDLHTHIDDEYARAGVDDPKILLTTSRDPSSRLLQFVKEMKSVFPNSQRINRGAAVIKELIEASRANDVTDLVIVHEHRGEPDGMIISHLPYGPTAYFGLSNVVMRHDIKDGLDNVSEALPHLIFDRFDTKLGRRVQNILKYLFPVPKLDSQRVMTFANQQDFISFRHHVYKKDGHKDIDLKEIGPRFEMRLYQIKLGTVDQTEAENEWVLRPYQNTAKKRKELG